MAEKREHLLDYLTKPSGYMTIIILIITIIATFWVAFHFQDKKELSIQESQYNFLTRNKIDESDLNQHIQVYYDDKKIYDPYVIKITITNTGNQEITEDDFKSDKFEISFNENIILYDISISNATPQNIKEDLTSKLEIKDNCLLISPFLLNADESFTLSLITNYETEIFYNFRIAGISNIKKGAPISLFKSYIFLIVFTLIINITSIAFTRNSHTKSRLAIKLLMMCIITIMMTMLIFIPIYEQSFSFIKTGNIQQFVFK